MAELEKPEKPESSLLELLKSTWGAGSENVIKKSEKYIAFDRNIHFTFGEGDRQIPYRPRTAEEKRKATTFKYGQLKLFLCELMFLNFYFDPKKHKKPQVLYIGAALGTHIAALANMYPMIEFHLYDPQPFNRKVLDPLSNITIYQQFFTEDDVEEWVDKRENNEAIFLIIDIRNTNYGIIKNPKENQAAYRKNEKYVWDDMLFQKNIFEQIKPTKALLKMRLPYYQSFMTKDEIQYKYLDGIVYRQQFAPQTSSETRLVPHDADEKGEYPERTWDIRTYENTLSSHNKELRETAKFVNPFSINSKKIKSNDFIAENIGLQNDYDSTAATIIICDYLIKFGIDPAYDQFYELAKQIFITVGESIGYKYNLRGMREKNFFVDEDGKVLVQKSKISEAEDPENDPNAIE